MCFSQDYNNKSEGNHSCLPALTLNAWRTNEGKYGRRANFLLVVLSLQFNSTLPNETNKFINQHDVDQSSDVTRLLSTSIKHFHTIIYSREPIKIDRRWREEKKRTNEKEKFISIWWRRFFFDFWLWSSLCCFFIWVTFFSPVNFFRPITPTWKMNLENSTKNFHFIDKPVGDLTRKIIV